MAQLAEELGVRLTIRGDLAEDALAEEYAVADIFALLSPRETWGVVVNEAAASGFTRSSQSAPVATANHQADESSPNLRALFGTQR